MLILNTFRRPVQKGTYFFSPALVANDKLRQSYGKPLQLPPEVHPRSRGGGSRTRGESGCDGAREIRKDHTCITFDGDASR
jgi:hypothetical protein